MTPGPASTMTYVSTRGQAPVLGFADAMLKGLAQDGGLYVPAHWPALDGPRIAALFGLAYEDAATELMMPFIGDAMAVAEFRTLVQDAYSGFRHRVRCPLVQIGSNSFLLELFHGPTLAFKDVAMQFIGRLFATWLSHKGERLTIVGATSGDTGSSAIEAFRGQDSVDVFIMYPDGRVSDVQRRQMTTPQEANVHALAIEGDFDDCQRLLKSLFNDSEFRDEARLGAVNSINWARVLAQVVYYFTAAVALGAPDRKVSFVVPTGNFGDVYAGYVARRMGLPIDRLVIATNQNDILDRTLRTGSYRMSDVKPSISPSMDIQVSSNFERVLFDGCGRDASQVRHLMAALATDRGFDLPPGAAAFLRGEFASGRASEAETAETIRAVQSETGRTLCPHTAVAVKVARDMARAGGQARDSDGDSPVVILATAHAAKFPDAVEAACGVRPPLPTELADIFDRPERMTRVANDPAAIKSIIMERTAACRRS